MSGFIFVLVLITVFGTFVWLQVMVLRRRPILSFVVDMIVALLQFLG